MSNYVDVFPIQSGTFGLSPDWLTTYAAKFAGPTHLIMGLLLIISVGLMALRRFEDVNFERKLWGVPILLLAVFAWPSIVLSIKSVVDTFNEFLCVSVFHLKWEGFGFAKPAGFSIGWSVTALAKLLPNLAYWIIYSFYTIFVFFYGALGTFIVAKGILRDEIEGLLELVGEITILFLWQTTLVILVAFVMPEIVSAEPPDHARAIYYFRALILGIMIFFVPSLTNKLVRSVSQSFVPMGFRWGGAFLGLTLFSRASGGLMNMAGLSAGHGVIPHGVVHGAVEAEEFAARYRHREHARHLEHEVEHLSHSAHHAGHDEHGQHADHGEDDHHHDDGLWSAAVDAHHPEGDHGDEHAS